MKRYKITLSSNTVYKEIELAPDAQQIRVGTSVDCDIRLRKEMFFEPIKLLFIKNKEEWIVQCSDNLYLTVGDIRKLMTKSLVHGDILEIKYQESDHRVFTMDFLIDFDDGKKKYQRVIDISGITSLTIGASPNCNISIGGQYIKDDTLVLNRKRDGFVIDIQNTTYGVYINGKKAKSKDIWKNGDFLSVSDYFFYFKHGEIWTQIHPKMGIHSLRHIDYLDVLEESTYPKFNRNTRIKTVIRNETIEILDPPSKPKKPKNNILLQLMPSLGMLLTTGIMASMGGSMILFSLISGCLAIVTTIAAFVEGKSDYKKNITNRIDTYNSYIQKKRSEIETNRSEEKLLLDKQFIAQEEECRRFASFSDDLFDRGINDDDFLSVRLGVGLVEAKRAINYKKQERLEIDDELQMMPQQICDEYKDIQNAPIICDLKTANAVGIYGSEKNRFEILKNMVVDITARQFYSDVKLIFVAQEEHKDKIYWLRFLPHVYLETIGIRGIVCNDESKNVIFEYLYKEMTLREQSKSFENRIVVFFYDEYEFNSHPISKIVNKAKDLGITLIFLATEKKEIPVGCEYLIEVSNATSGLLIDTTDDQKNRSFTYSTIADDAAKHIVEILAPIYTEEISLESSLTKNISMFDLLNIISVDDLNLSERWSKTNVVKSMAAPVGVSKTGTVYLDLHDKVHGPHGLVAGTTGSGKSEILQTYILSMASLYSPDEVGFLMIDFKGGGMVNQFKDLPHLLGAITNIDGKEINRSLKSIKAELQKRQRMFAEAEVNHINHYISKFKSGAVSIPLPHLIIIVDEFAELKAEQPDFMKELISAARIGRSLGVHLILATQKPSGQVDEQIWSNSRFKLCLKVQTQEDSNEVLKSPLAAEIKEPGRAYLQIGNNELFELFQSAYSGAPENQVINTSQEFAIFELAASGKRLPIFIQKAKTSDAKSISQLDAMVQHIASYCETAKIKRLSNICLPPLPEMILFVPIGSIEKKKNTSLVSVGIYDDPDSQMQSDAYLDVDNKNTVIIGSPQTGKTNLLQTIIRTIAETKSSDEAHIYIIDFASMVLKNFEKLAHVGGVVTSSEDEKLKNLFKLLNAEIATRKEKLLSIGVSSFSAYKDAGYSDIPQIYLVIDNLTALIELYLQDDETLLVLIREGLAVGIATIVANMQTAGIGYRYFSNFSNRIALHCNDNNEYSNLFDQISLQPSETPGRCVLAVDKKMLECQTFLAFDGEREIDRVKEIFAFIDNVNSNNQGKRANQIPAIPTLLTDTDMREMFKAVHEGYEIPIGVTYSDVTPYSLDLMQLGNFGICGNVPKYAKNFIKRLMLLLQEKSVDYPVEVQIIDDIKRTFADLKDMPIVKMYTLDVHSVTNMITTWYEELEQRYQQMLIEDNTKKNPLKILIIQNSDAAKIINDDFDAMSKYTEIITRFKAMGQCIIYSNYENTSLSYDAPEPLRQIKQDQHILFFGDLDTLKPFDPPYEAIRENKKKLVAGDAYYIRGNDVTKLKIVEPVDKSFLR